MLIAPRIVVLKVYAIFYKSIHLPCSYNIISISFETDEYQPIHNICIHRNETRNKYISIDLQSNNFLRRGRGKNLTVCHGTNQAFPVSAQPARFHIHLSKWHMCGNTLSVKLACSIWRAAGRQWLFLCPLDKLQWEKKRSWSAAATLLRQLPVIWMQMHVPSSQPVCRRAICVVYMHMNVCARCKLLLFFLDELALFIMHQALSFRFHALPFLPNNQIYHWMARAGRVATGAAARDAAIF